MAVAAAAARCRCQSGDIYVTRNDSKNDDKIVSGLNLDGSNKPRTTCHCG